MKISLVLLGFFVLGSYSQESTTTESYDMYDSTTEPMETTTAAQEEPTTEPPAATTAPPAATTAAPGATTAAPGATTAAPGATTAAPGATTVAGSSAFPTPAPGKDAHPWCCYWASATQCENNKAYMLPYCQFSCGSYGCTVATASTCRWAVAPICRNSTAGAIAPGATTTVAPAANPACSDSPTYASQCPGWAAAGECNINPYWMKPNCQMSCNSCGATVGSAVTQAPIPGCADSNTMCGYWASTQECTTNPAWMTVNCALSCNTCG